MFVFTHTGLCTHILKYARDLQRVMRNAYYGNTAWISNISDTKINLSLILYSKYTWGSLLYFIHTHTFHHRRMPLSYNVLFRIHTRCIRAHRCWGVCLYQIAGVWMWNRHHGHSWPWSYGHTRLSHPTICIKIRRAKLFFRSNQNQGLPIAFTFRIQWLNLNKHFIPKSSGIFKS